MARIAACLFVLLLAACGDSLVVPEALPLTRLPAGQDFVLTLVMTSCSDTCATYDEPQCDVSVDREDRVIRVDACVGINRDAVETCLPVCGREILAHCDVDALPAGTYTVRSKGFAAQIELE